MGIAGVFSGAMMYVIMDPITLHAKFDSLLPAR
jgi:hypothetical protein